MSYTDSVKFTSQVIPSTPGFSPLILRNTPTPLLLLSASKGVVTNASNIVTTWSDLSGNGNDFIAGSGSVPYLPALGQLEFGGSQTLVRSSLTLPTDVSIIVVAKPSRTSFYATFVELGSAGFRMYSNNAYEDAKIGSLQTGGSINPVALIDTGATPKRGSNQTIFGIRASGTNYAHYRNLDILSSGTLSTAFAPTASACTLGAGNGGSSAFFGTISFVGIWSAMTLPDFESAIQTLMLPPQQWTL